MNLTEQLSGAKAPGFKEPMELLKSCHNKVLDFSVALVKLSAKLPVLGWTEETITSAEQIRRYFNIAGIEHHLDEEKHLFPAVISLDPELKDPHIKALTITINQLIKEHVELDACWKKLDLLLANQTDDYQTLQLLAKQFADTQAQHAETENTQIFAFVEQHFSLQKLEDIGKAIATRRGVKLESLPSI